MGPTAFIPRPGKAGAVGDSARRGCLRRIGQIVSCVGSRLGRPLQIRALTHRMYLSRCRFRHVVQTCLRRPLTACVTQRQIRHTMVCLRVGGVHLTRITRVIKCRAPRSLSGTFGRFFNVSPATCHGQHTRHCRRFDALGGRSLGPRVLARPRLGLMCVHVVKHCNRRRPCVRT